jgi:hypothetical protein
MLSLDQAILQLCAMFFFSRGQIAMKQALTILKSKPDDRHVLTILSF